jgi:hypothetical protein
MRQENGSNDGQLMKTLKTQRVHAGSHSMQTCFCSLQIGKRFLGHAWDPRVAHSNF